MVKLKFMLLKAALGELFPQPMGRTWHLITPFVLLFGFLSNITIAQPHLAKGIVGYWPVDSCEVNQSLNALPSTDFVLIDGPTYSYGLNGVADQDGSFYFDGQSKIVLEAPLRTSEVSLSIWFNSSNSRGGTIASVGDYGYGINLNEQGRLHAYTFVSGSEIKEFIYEGINLADGQWHHAIITFDGYILKVFLDGRQINSPGLSNNKKEVYFGATNRLTLGGSLDQQRINFTGSIDEILLYNRAITDTEVELLAKRCKPEFENNLGTGLLVQLPLSEDAENKSPNATKEITLSSSGGLVAEPCNGEKDAMMFFNGRDSYLTINGRIQLTESFSLSMTFNTRSSKESFILGWCKGGYDVILSPPGHIGGIAVRVWQTEDRSFETISDHKVNDGLCHTICLTFDGSIFQVYLDGSPIHNGEELSEPITYISDRLWIGKDSTEQRSGYQGKLGNILIYNRALTLKEIKKLGNPTPKVNALSIQKFNYGGSNRNNIPPDGCVFVIYNSSNSNKQVQAIPSGIEEQARKFKLKPQEQIIKVFEGYSKHQIKIVKN